VSELEADARKALGECAEEANRHHKLCEENYRSAIEHAWHAGMALRSAQSLLEHGSWLPWLADNFSSSQRTAYRYMEIAMKFATRDKLPAGSLRAALAQTSGEKCDRCGKLVTSPTHKCKMGDDEYVSGSPRVASREANKVRRVREGVRSLGQEGRLDALAARERLGPEEAREIAKQLREARTELTRRIDGLEGRINTLGVVRKADAQPMHEDRDAAS
jgi:Protein of unknown function (DUF3102)